MEKLDEIMDSLKRPPTITAIVGAGASVASGLKTFRGEDGLYKGVQPEDLASVQGFRKDPKLVWSWYKWRISGVFIAKPNSIHYSLVELETAGLLDKVITQNVDGLHRRAGQSEEKLIEIHGNIINTHCLDNCGRKTTLDSVPEQIPILCSCGSYQRPAVVWFGEQLDSEDIRKSERALQRSDIILTIGTSGMVTPVATMPYIAKQHGAFLIDFNINTTPISHISDLFLQGGAEETVPQIVDYIIKKCPQNDESST